MSRRTTVALVLAALLVVLPSRAHAATTGGTAYSSPSRSTSSHHGGTAAQAQASPATPAPTASATVGPDGLAVAPAGAPQQVLDLIAAGNRIATTPYRYGGGHKSFDDTAYDCSGSVSYALHGAGLLDFTLDSTGLGRWGVRGPGAWITVYANKGHAYMVVAGLRFDTSGRQATGSRWQPAPRSAAGFHVRHPLGL